MPVNLPPLGDILEVPGVRLGSARAPVKPGSGRDDVALIELAPGSVAAGVFTRSGFRAPPVVLCEERLARAEPRYLLINSGNANCATGAAGRAAAQACCRAVAEVAGVGEDEVLPFSTGVIGEPLPVERISTAARRAHGTLSASGWVAAARAIMTTDTAPKVVSSRGEVDGVPVTVTGMCKGSGMICPNMATMLAYVATDVPMTRAVVADLVVELAGASFNRITVDGDTSTNDSFVLMATGRAGMAPITSPMDGRFARVRELLSQTCIELAQRLVRDAEGATKFVTLVVEEARDHDEALAVAYTVAHSPLVKTAMFASDPNWGRFCMAIGRSGIDDLDPDGVSLFLDDVCVARGGQMSAGYRESDGARVMAQDEFTVRIGLGRGTARERIWTSDLSYEYVRINAEYRT